MVDTPWISILATAAAAFSAIWAGVQARYARRQAEWAKVQGQAAQDQIAIAKHELSLLQQSIDIAKEHLDIIVMSAEFKISFCVDCKRDKNHTNLWISITVRNNSLFSVHLQSIRAVFSNGENYDRGVLHTEQISSGTQIKALKFPATLASGESCTFRFQETAACPHEYGSATYTPFTWVAPNYASMPWKDIKGIEAHVNNRVFAAATSEDLNKIIREINSHQ